MTESDNNQLSLKMFIKKVKVQFLNGSFLNPKLILQLQFLMSTAAMTWTCKQILHWSWCPKISKVSWSMWKLQNLVSDITESSKGTPLWGLPHLSFCSYPSHQTSNYSHSPSPCKDFFDACAPVSCKSRCIKLSTRCGGQLCARLQTETSQEAEKKHEYSQAMWTAADI